jgi:DNA-directed RNA polymerase specialized sigma54-like protein
VVSRRGQHGSGESQEGAQLLLLRQIAEGSSPGLKPTPEVLARARNLADLTQAFVESLDVQEIIDHAHEESRRQVTPSKPLVMTPQLQQAIKLLQLSHVELVAQVQQEMEQNPLLERPDETVERDLSEKAPGRNFTAEDAPYITTDVFILKMGEGYTVVLNDDGLSKLRISGAYRQALRESVMEPSKAKEFIQDKLRSAMWLIRSIHQRHRTIYKVTESIVKFQHEFFDKGIAHLKPLTLRDVAEGIGMHESTVRRVSTAKYVHTPQGIYELTYFFTR